MPLWSTVSSARPRELQICLKRMQLVHQQSRHSRLLEALVTLIFLHPHEKTHASNCDNGALFPQGVHSSCTHGLAGIGRLLSKCWKLSELL